jgi:hypothetical protein
MMKCCDKEIMILSGFHHVDNVWGFNVGACQTCGNVFRMDGWPNKDVFALTLSGEVEKIDMKKKAQEEFDKVPGPTVTVPSGLEVEMLPEKYYMRRYQGSVMNRPTPNNIGGWAMFVLKDRSVFEKLTDEDKEFLHDQQFEVYRVWNSSKA